ncbi:MAG: hypothetical protein KAI33_05770 [Elusimicrobiales bacterium]|nr:hypothetical protein [Elusimicrobiales bacterium]
MKEENLTLKKMYFTGIAGAGMSALSQIAAMEGHEVSGSDRNFDNNRSFSLRDKLEKLSIKIFPQDGSGISKNTNILIVSTAVENENPDILKAKELNIPIIHRSEFLSDYVDRFKTIAVAGTSGKSTVAAMIYEILEKAGKSPSIITGAALESIKKKGFIGNAWRGESDILIVEADESDGTIVNYHPHSGIILNISKDHKDEDEIEKIFLKFAGHTKKLYIDSLGLNADVFSNASVFGGADTGFEARDKKYPGFSAKFKIKGIEFLLPVPGECNIQNALAAARVCEDFGVELKDSASALAGYAGIERRFNMIGEINQIRVIDDYAHNPAKISASIEAARKIVRGRLIAIYQPHGFAPTKHLKDDLIEVFSTRLKDEDILLMPEIYYAGGTASKDISSKDLTDEINKKGKKAVFFAERKDIVSACAKLAEPADIVLIMGARDWSLSDFAQSVFEEIKNSAEVEA